MPAQAARCGELHGCRLGFVDDSPLEGQGFEPSVPRQKDNAFETHPRAFIGRTRRWRKGIRIFGVPSASTPTLNRFGELTYAGSSRFVAGPFCEFGPTITD
jgi:hypothetical protein